MGNHNHGLVVSTAECFYYIFHQTAVVQVKSVKRFVEYQKLRVFHESTCQKYKSLLAARQLQETPVCQLLYSEYIHPEQTHFPILFFRTLVETDRIVKSACHNIYGRNVLQISPVHLWADVADMLLDFPYTLAAAALAVEQSDVAGIALWIVGTNQTQEC